jgi:hypothetical protein
MILMLSAGFTIFVLNVVRGTTGPATAICSTASAFLPHPVAGHSHRYFRLPVDPAAGGSRNNRRIQIPHGDISAAGQSRNDAHAVHIRKQENDVRPQVGAFCSGSELHRLVHS